MKTLTSAIKVKVDVKDKKDELPFEVTNHKPNDELLNALKEGEDIIQEIRNDKRTGYNNVNEMLKAITDD